MKTIIDKWRKEAFQKGFLLGFQKGFLLGAQKEGVSIVLLLLKRKFGSLNEETKNRISELSVKKLEELSVALLDFQKIEDLTTWLRKHAKRSSKKAQKKA